MIVSGNGYIALGLQSSKGVAATPSIFVPYLSENFETAQDNVTLNDSGDNEYLLDNLKTKHKESFGFDVYARPGICSYLSAYMLGTSTIAGTIDPYTHTITRGSAERDWLTIDRQLNTTVIQRLIDCKIEKVTISGNSGRPIRINITGNALDSSIITTAQEVDGGLILHNTLDSTTAVLNSRYGPDLTIVGTPEYSACQFNNGVKCIANKYVYVPLVNFLNYDSFAISFFCKYYAYSIISCGTSDSQIYDILYCTDAFNIYPIIAFYHRNGYSQLLLFLNATNYFGLDLYSGIDIALNDIVFYSFIYDSKNTNPNILKIYYYNLTSGQSSIFTTTSSSGTASTFTPTATHILSLGQQHVINRGGNVIIDNLKIYNYAKNDYSDLDKEFTILSEDDPPFMFYDGDGRFKYNTTVDDLFKSFNVNISINSGGGLLNDQYEIIDLPDFSMNVDCAMNIYTNNFTRFKEINYNTSTTPQEDFSTGSFEVDCQYVLTSTRQFKITIPELIWRSIGGINLNPSPNTMTENIAGLAKKQATTELLTIVSKNAISTTIT